MMTVQMTVFEAHLLRMFVSAPQQTHLVGGILGIKNRGGRSGAGGRCVDSKRGHHLNEDQGGRTEENEGSKCCMCLGGFLANNTFRSNSHAVAQISHLQLASGHEDGHFGSLGHNNRPDGSKKMQK